MPEISRFYGITVRVNPRDHFPAHFHANYGEHEIAIAIATGAVLAGELPNHAWRLIKEWMEIHRSEILENWNCAQAGRSCFKIEPL
ncbi:MAG: DUF4160 domain-containing protein [Verrucomicrobia bacterium]|nr:DUF4160 domain-containing protein [Verrucomicrobiota bacterium]